MLADAGISKPLRENGLRQAHFHTREYKSFGHIVFPSIANELKSLAAYRITDKLFGFLHPEFDVYASVTVGLQIVPSQSFHIAEAQSCKAGEQESSFQGLRLARSSGQTYQFIL